MYVVARHSLKLSGGRVALKGQPVPEALSWQESVLKAHLNLGWLIQVPDEPSEPIKAEPASAPVEEKAPQPSGSGKGSNKKSKRR